jgi:hypothetical protein
MLRIRLSFLLIALFALGIAIPSQVVFAQQPLVTDTAPEARDAAAIATIQKSLEALGGVSAIAAVRTLQTSGQINKIGSQTPMSFKWMLMVSGSNFEFRRETNDGAHTRVFASGHGNPGFGIVGNKAKSLSQHMVIAAVPLEAPAVLLYAEFQDPTYSFRSLSASGGGQIHIQITNQSNIVMQAVVKQDWYFDPKTFLPASVEYNLPQADNALDSIRGSCIYTNYVVEEGIQYPGNIQAFEQGIEISQITIASTRPNAPVTNSDTDMPLQSVGVGGSAQ